MAKIDMTGKVYGRWTVISPAPNRDGETYWNCICECGTEKEMCGYNLRKGASTSCGCYAAEQAAIRGKKKAGVLSGTRLDLIGQTIGRLSVISKAENVGKYTAWLCMCECGNEVVVTREYLRNPKLKHSCGCWRSEICTEKILKVIQSGEAHPRFKDLTGRRYGRLLVVGLAGKKIKHYTTWTVQCDCGVIKDITQGGLDSGRTNSCGCFRREDSSRKIKAILATNYGPNNPAWNPNLTDEDRVDRRRLVHIKEWAKAVKVRDNFICQICGVRSGPLNSHHLDSYREHPEGRSDVNNGATVCAKCHKEFHLWVGWRKPTTATQFQEFKDNYISININTQEEAQ